MNRSCAGQLADGMLVGAAAVRRDDRQRRRLEGVTVVSIDANRKVAAELFARQAGVAQTAKSPKDASSDGDDSMATAQDAMSAKEMRELGTANERRSRGI